jgi:hypothetical protein
MISCAICEVGKKNFVITKFRASSKVCKIYESSPSFREFRVAKFCFHPSILTVLLHDRVMIGEVSIDKQRQCGQFEHQSFTPLPFYPLPPSVSYIAIMPISARRWLFSICRKQFISFLCQNNFHKTL